MDLILKIMMCYKHINLQQIIFFGGLVVGMAVGIPVLSHSFSSFAFSPIPPWPLNVLILSLGEIIESGM
jgi:hypothetical protein